MSQLPLATAIETLFSLLGEYLLEDGKRSTAGVDQYVEWLRSHKHQELADIVCDNANVADSLRFLMEQHHF